MADDDEPTNLDLDETSQPMEVDEPSILLNTENECYCRSERCQDFNLTQQLDKILDPGLIFSAPSQPERLWTILAHGHQDAATFIKTLSEYRIESHCSLAWPTGYVAYRCRTCSALPTMSLCAECFRAGDHSGHDYNMFKSRSGGACDCGFNIMKASGHCSNHGHNAIAPKFHESIPENLTCLTSRAMPRIISRLVIQLRRHAVGQTMETDIYLDCLMQIANSNAILKNLMVQVILSADLYSSQAELLSNHPDSRVSKIVRESQKILKRERKKLVAFKIPPSWPVTSKLISAFSPKGPHKTFLEELVFWMVVHEFHQKLVCFLLGFLMDDHYKVIFAKLFVNYYPNIAMCLASSPTDPRRNQQDSVEHLSRRILQVSVQIYNNSDLTRLICEEEMTLHTLIYCIRIMIEGSQPDGIFSALKTNPLCKHDSNAPKVVCCDNIILRDRQLSSFTEDLITILDFGHEAKRLLSDKKLLQTWMELVSYFQTMSPYKRELNEHAPYETGPRQSVFMIESEFCLVPLWTILDHLMSPDSVLYTSQLLESIHASLASWLYRMSIGPHSKLDTYFMSFHIPLHRMLAATLRHMIYVQKVPEDQVYKLLCDSQSIFGSKFSYWSAHGTRVAIKMDDFMKMLLLHPLQALTLYHQTRSGMWTRNGILTVNQAITYVHCAYCYSIIDMDMFLLRYFASRLKADTFLKSFLQKFYAWHCLSFTCGPIFSDPTTDALKVHYYFNIQPEQITQMVESCLVTLIQLLTLGNHCNISNREQTKQEMICLISVANRSYSYLTDMVPNVSEHHSRDEEMFPSLLDELTVYKPASHGSGGNLQQGYYTLKPDVWENDYNPILVLYRYYQRRDYQLSLDRFFQHAKSTGKLNRRSHSSALWPPLKIPDRIANFGPIDLGSLIRCQTLLGVVFSILYKSIYVEDIPDSMMAYTIHLLELALRRQMELPNEHSDKMDHDQHQDQKDRAKNPSFVGRYSYRELISYYENMPKGEAILKGRTIYSLFTEDPIKSEPNSNVKLFPFVKHALDLAFEATWFPFDSVIDNCLVHIETVHSLPRDEFDAMVQCTNGGSGTESSFSECPYATANSDRASNQTIPDVSTSSSTRSTESQTGAWSNLIGLEVEEVDDIEIEVDADDVEENDILEIDDLNDDDEVTVEVEDPDELELSLLNRLSASEASPSTSPGRLGGAVSEAGTFNSLAAAATISSTMEVVNSILPNLTNSQAAAATPEGELDLNNRRRDINIEGYIRLRDYMDRLGTQNLANQQNVTSDTPTAPATIHHRRAEEEGGSTSPLVNVYAGDNPGRQERTSLPSDWTTSPRQQLPPAQAQNLITERRAILDAQPRHMITNSPQPLALEGASASSMSGIASTSSASTSAANQDVQRADRSQGLAVEFSAFNQNLTQAIGQCTANLTESRQEHGASNQTERSLTEIDIQARFMGFFSTDTTSPSSSRINSSRIIRPRQTARRGNYRGAYLIEPYLPYSNPTNNNNNNATTANNNNNNNNNNSVQELVRRSVAVVPAIANAVRSTLNQRVGRTTTRTVAAGAAGVERNQGQVGRETREPDGSSRSSSNSPPPNPPAASERITPAIWMRNRVALLSSSAPYQLANRFITTGSTQQQIQLDQRSRRLRKEHRQHHGESIMTLLLRLHAKYSHQPRSYHYDESRARTNLDPRKRCRIGDGVHFVTIALDLICVSGVQIQQRVEYLTELIWPKPANEKVAEKGVSVDGCQSNERALRGETSVADSDDKEIGLKTSRAGKSSCRLAAAGDSRTPGACEIPASVFGLNLSNTEKLDSKPTNPLVSLTPEEKRRRAKERQARLMVEFANKQRAFMEKYAANISDLTATGAGSRPLSDLNTGPTSAMMAHSASAGVSSAAASGSGRSPQKYSELKLQASDKTQGAADSDPHGRCEEQPINLSSKANQEQATRSQSASDADNNRQAARRAIACESLWQHDAAPNDQAQSTSTSAAASSSSVVTSDKDISATIASGSNVPGGGQRNSHQQSSTTDVKNTKTSTVSASSSNETANDVPHYECCICGVGGLSDTANPLGQVVLLQSTSVYGHSHLRPRNERKLPCDETEHLSLKEETYAKYLERRIDILCDHFTKSSWLDSINIGAEGGVHVQSCGHHLHIECHQSYIRSLDLEDVMRMRNESDEFQCPVCRQLANSVLPILSDDFFLDTNSTGTDQAFPSTSKFSPGKTATKITSEPRDDPHCQRLQSGTKINYCDPAAIDADCSSHSTFFSTAITPSESLDDHIAQVGLQLRNRRAPNQQELQSSATFCSHLTKATGPQYRLIRTNASMHSLFLFLSSIARTNLEIGLIARSIKSQVIHKQAESSDGYCQASSDASDVATKLSQKQHQHCSGWQPTIEAGKRRHTCYQLLFHVLALNAQTLINNQWCTYEHIWSRLTHQIADADRLSVSLHSSEVPLLLRDPVAMLLQFLFTISGSKSHRRAHFTCLVKVLFNLTVIQSAALVLSYVGSVPQLRDDELSNQSPASSQLSQHTKIQLDRSQFPTMDQQLGESSLSATLAAHHTNAENNHRVLALEGLLSSVWTNLGSLLTKNKEEPLMNSVVRNSWPFLASRLEQELWRNNEREQQRQQERPTASQPDDNQTSRVKKLEFIENRIKLACLPFLRAAAFMQEHLYGGSSPNLICELNEDHLSEQAPVDEDFSRLVRCLELVSTNLTSNLEQTAAPTKATPTFEREALDINSHITLQQSLNWPSSAGSRGRNLVVSWSLELLQFAKQYSIAARTLLLSRPLAWYRPALMQLPHSFDDVFMFYYRRKCSLCQQVPKDVAVCLVCGAPICFRASCCKDRSRSRQVHSQHCGANTAVFLAVHTSAVVVIRGNRACVWGSVYLDAHDEEDNGLQRGKPLYMVPARFNLLETQWLSHSFDHTCGKRWIYLQEAQ